MSSSSSRWRPFLLLIAGLAAWPQLSGAPPLITVELTPVTLKAFEEYVQARESYFDQRTRGTSFLWTDESAERARLVRQGQTVVEAVSKNGAVEIKNGLIHDWVGAVFIPGATLDRTLAFVQNYDNHKNVYQPEVLDSKLRSRKGDEFQVYLRLLKKKVITVVLNTEHEVHYYRVDKQRTYSRSYSRRIAEVDDPGGAHEKEFPVGTDHGFLWRLNSYWHFQERDGGVYVECEAISLTRNIPIGLGWMVMPIVKELPHESLTNTLALTRSSLLAKQ